MMTARKVYRMSIGLRVAFFKFHVRNLYLTWYYNRRNRSD
jgi:hypothetical protein